MERISRGMWREKSQENCCTEITEGNWLKSDSLRNFPGDPVVKNLPSNAGDVGLILGWGIKILYVSEQLSPCTATRETPHTSTKRPHDAMKTQGSKKKIQLKKKSSLSENVWSRPAQGFISVGSCLSRGNRQT